MGREEGGAGVIVNSFQRWAITTLAASGIKAVPSGNWLRVDGDAVMSRQGVLALCDRAEGQVT